MPTPFSPDDFKLNQNLWGLLVGLVALGAVEYYELCALWWFGVVISGALTLSILLTTYAYTVRYWRHKFRPD